MRTADPAPAFDSVIRWGSQRARTGPWRGDHRVALLTPLPDAPAPTAEFVRRCLATLAERGYSHVVTGALAPSEQAGFLAAGFGVGERLHLLAHDLRSVGPERRRDGPGWGKDGPGRRALRRAHRRDRPAVLAVDAVAFEPFWRLDDAGLDDALAATPAARFRVAVAEGDVVGYAVTGRAGRRGYVQRLAVHPDAARRGYGSALVLDGLAWLQRWGCSRALVNTQVRNASALALYERLGFRPEPAGLAVLTAGLGGSGPGRDGRFGAAGGPAVGRGARGEEGRDAKPGPAHGGAPGRRGGDANEAPAGARAPRRPPRDEA